MALNNSQQDLILRRREAVSTLRLKRLTQREIVATLPSYNPPIVDERGEPFSLATINGDLKALRKEWRAAANVATADHVAEQMAALEQVERRGWTDGDMATVLRAIALKMKLTGTEAPTKIEHEGNAEKPLEIIIRYADRGDDSASASGATGDQATGEAL